MSAFEEGWSYTSPVPLVITPSADTRSTIAITVATARILFFDRESGKPLGGRPIAVYDAEAPFPIGSCQTDAEGFASFSLTPGEYRFLLDPSEVPFLEPDSDQRSAVLLWTEQGPQAERLEL